MFKQLFFNQTSKRGQILTKTFFLQKVSHILLNYASLLFCSIFGEIIRELFFLDIKLTISEKSTKRLRKFVFLAMFERGKILRLIWICLNYRFMINQLKGININKNGSSLQIGPHSAKLCLSVFFKHFGVYS